MMRIAKSPHTPSPSPTRVAIGTLLWAAGAVAAVTMLLLGPASSPPLYNGLGFPDQPYRWIEKPEGFEPNPVVYYLPPDDPELPPVDVSTTVQWLEEMPPITAVGTEQGPQALFRLGANSLEPPAGTQEVTITAQPLAAPGPAPEGGEVFSNMYRFSAVSDDGSLLELPADRPMLINLRSATQTADFVVFYHLKDGQWSQVGTRKIGYDIYAAFIKELGDYVLVKLPEGTRPTAQASGPGADQKGFDPLATTDGSTLVTQDEPNSTWWILGGLAGFVVFVLGWARLRMKLSAHEAPAE